MSAEIVRLSDLHRIPSGSRIGMAGDVGSGALSSVITALRSRLDLPNGLDDDAIAHSIEEVMAASSERDRWSAAFNSTLGLYLSLRSEHFDEALRQFIAIATQTPLCGSRL
ncbi:MAG: hypothetical protein ACFCUN_00050 [Hyphomicrobiaceae bacterium]